MSTMQPFPSSSSTSNLSPSIVTICLILIITLLATICLILLIRRFHLSRRHQPPSTTTSTSSRLHLSPTINDSAALIDSLPLFSLSSVTRRSGDGDCAVCLSKFRSHDQLRLLPLCCHAFHAQCVDSWLRSNLTCPLCRSNVSFSTSNLAGDGSFRLEIGSVSQRQADSTSSGHRRSYSMGSFDYVVEGDSEVSVSNGRSTAVSDKEEDKAAPAAPEASLADDVAEGRRSWVRECMDRVAAATLLSQTLSFRSSGRYFTGSSRRSNTSGVAAELNLEAAGSIEDEISQLFRWASGV